MIRVHNGGALIWKKTKKARICITLTAFRSLFIDKDTIKFTKKLPNITVFIESFRLWLDFRANCTVSSFRLIYGGSFSS